MSKIIVHENYTNAEYFQKKLNKFYDLALLELSEDVDLATFTPACLARASDLTTFDNKMALATGKNHRWQKPGFYSKDLTHLQKFTHIDTVDEVRPVTKIIHHHHQPAHLNSTLLLLTWS